MKVGGEGVWNLLRWQDCCGRKTDRNW